jgi:hypothetical protein
VGPDLTIARSRRTEEFDISSNFDYVWFSNSETPLPDMYFFDSKPLGNDLEPHCGSFLHDGICDDSYNNFAYNYDQGDCCASTCTHPKCGQDGIEGAFGSNGAEGIGFRNCRDPNMVTLTIRLNKISNSRNAFIRNITNEQRVHYAESGVDYDTETPMKPHLFVQCGLGSYARTILSMDVDKSMENGTETIMVEDGADCRISVRNSVIGGNRWDSKPIWFINYTVYHGKSIDEDNRIISAYSGDEDSTYFRIISDCYFGILDGMKISTAYEKNSDSSLALDWLVTGLSLHSKCEDDFLQERFALIVMYLAAPNSTLAKEAHTPIYCDSHSNIFEIFECKAEREEKIQNYTWLSTRHQCDWDNINCNEGSVTTIDLYNERLSGTIPTWVGKLTELDYMHYDFNDLSGTIPSEFGLLTKLTVLDIDNNKFNGAIPTEFGLLTNMRKFDLDSNELVGSIPTELGLMINLREFDLAENGISGSIPSEIYRLTNIISVEFGKNQLSGAIQSEIGLLEDLQKFQLGKK